MADEKPEVNIHKVEENLAHSKGDDDYAAPKGAFLGVAGEKPEVDSHKVEGNRVHSKGDDNKAASKGKIDSADQGSPRENHGYSKYPSSALHEKVDPNPEKKDKQNPKLAAKILKEVLEVYAEAANGGCERRCAGLRLVSLLCAYTKACRVHVAHEIGRPPVCLFALIDRFIIGR